MISAILLACACGLLGDAPAPSSIDLETYQAARARAGRDPDAQVRLALWCEAHGLEAERIRHLSMAALSDPTHATARALMGLVSEGGRWGHPDAVAARIKADPEAAALRAEYEDRRDRADWTADDQWKLARWAEDHGLKAEATAHDTAVTRLDPSREAAWKKLGCQKYDGRWMTPAQADAIRSDQEAQARADRHWLPTLEKWRDALSKPSRKEKAEAALLEVVDPRVVPSIRKVFAGGGPADQARAVRLLGQVDSLEATRGLAWLAVFGSTEEIRRPAIETLRNRDVRGALDVVIRLLREPVKFEARPNLGPDEPGLIRIEGKDANVVRVYASNVPALNDFRQVLRMTPGRISQLVSDAGNGANRRLQDDVQAIETTNATIQVNNQHALATLHGITGKDFGLDQNAWQAWWTDRQGYAVKAPTGRTGEKPTITQFIDPYPSPSHSCFAAGTPVQTIDGPRAIEDLKVGDRILTQDTTKGTLSYQPALAVFHNPPVGTLRIRLGGESIVATGIHRFWKAGLGWTMARDLKPGDPIRILGGTSRVESVEPEVVQPVFNLEVARGADFFVGKAGALVHDNSLVQPVPRPFDAPPSLTSDSGRQAPMPPRRE